MVSLLTQLIASGWNHMESKIKQSNIRQGQTHAYCNLFRRCGNIFPHSGVEKV